MSGEGGEEGVMNWLWDGGVGEKEICVLLVSTVLNQVVFLYQFLMIFPV